MASPREVAEKAFTLLQEALRDSEARADALDEELHRKKPSKNQLEQKLDVVTHRLEAVEEDAQRWKREAGHLEEVVENERAKIAQLKKKLEIAESGPEKLTKKEINFWRAKAEDFDKETSEYKTRIASLRNDVKERDRELTKLEDELENFKNRSSVSGEEQRAHQEKIDILQRQITSLDNALTEAHSAKASLKAELDGTRRQLEESAEKLAGLDRSRHDDQSERAHLERSLAERDEQVSTLAAKLDGARQQLDSSRKELAELQRIRDEGQSATARIRVSLSEHEGRIAALTAELEKARSDMLKGEEELGSLRRKLSKATGDLDQLRKHDKLLGEELAQARSRAESAGKERDKAVRSVEQLTKALQERESEAKALAERQSEIQSTSAGAQEQIAGLEAELKEEKECTENLSELANERLDQLNQLQERLEEVEERYEEAQWRLGKAQHFERLVHRRKGLVRSLIETLRAKTKSNAALKAGLDGLRTFKATAETEQQQLLAQMDKLKTQLGKAEEAVAQHQSKTLTQAELVSTDSRTSELEERLNTQAELIQSLEEELKVSKADRRGQSDKDEELQRLKDELTTKNEVITRLQSDVDEQQKKLAKLRGSDSETMRLKAGAEKDKTMIDALEREIGQLRDALARQAGGESGTASSSDQELQAKLKEREDSVTRLLGAVKENEAKIAELTEQVEGWKRKYEFVSADAPDAYKSADAYKTAAEK